MSITLAQLREQARQRADMENSNFVKDSELNAYINNSIAELHDILCEAYDAEYFTKDPYEFTTVANQDSYDLPEDFYELKGVDIRINANDWIVVEKYNFKERNRYQEFGVWDLYGVNNVRYRIIGNKIRFTPIPDGTAQVRLWYVPVATKLVNDADTLDDQNAYSEYVIVDAAIKMMQKEESDVSVLVLQKEALINRIRGKAANRDAGSPESITDIYAANDDYYYRGGSDR